MTEWSMKSWKLPVMAMLAGLTACAGEESEAAVSTADDAVRAAPAAVESGGAEAPAPALTPDPGRQVIEIRVAPGGGMSFEPAEITARRGDVLRFVANNGVHNVVFAPEDNPGVADLPSASEYLLRSGDRYELKVELEPGSYEFQCDPHEGMGMVGRLTVVG